MGDVATNNSYILMKKLEELYRKKMVENLTFELENQLLRLV